MREAWDRFFFAKESPAPQALVRILLCSVLLIPVGSRWPDARILYSSDGAPASISAWWPGTTPLPIPGGTACVVLYTVLVLALMCGVLGWRTRWSLLVAAPLMVWFAMLDVTGTLTKYFIIAFHALVILALGQSGAAYSLDALRRRREGKPPVTEVEAWPRRLIAVFLCVLYFATALTKFKTPVYLTGEHTLMWMRTDMNWPHPLGLWVADRPVLVMLAAQAAVFWEAAFCVLVWLRPTRRPMLAVGAAFHVGTWVLLGLAVFPWVMLSMYPVFLAPDVSRRALDAAGRWLGGWTKAVPRAGWAMPAALAGLLVCGVGVERAIEARPKPPLPEMNAGVAKSLVFSSSQSGPADWLWQYRVGTTFVGGWAVGESEVFEPGDVIQMQLCLIRPHPDFYVTVRLEDAAGRTVDLATRLIARENSRWTLPWTFPTNFPPGRYRFVLESDGTTMGQHPFEIAAE